MAKTYSAMKQAEKYSSVSSRIPSLNLILEDIRTSFPPIADHQDEEGSFDGQGRGSLITKISVLLIAYTVLAWIVFSYYYYLK